MNKLPLTAMLLTSLFASATFASQYDKPGFITEVEDGRLWVFREGSKELVSLPNSSPTSVLARTE
ncbi:MULTISPECIES: hypothetical protein [Pseudomonas]|jgi:hypothetical protein|uniref:hypothetical protein n=1 Tax=Pseudomonas sp. MIL9 TaxID=2807620 RepID=UPI001CB955BC|nr:hypothetical protein [Pseudomonas sp. MIL9]